MKSVQSDSDYKIQTSHVKGPETVFGTCFAVIIFYLCCSEDTQFKTTGTVCHPGTNAKGKGGQNEQAAAS